MPRRPDSPVRVVFAATLLPLAAVAALFGNWPTSARGEEPTEPPFATVAPPSSRIGRGIDGAQRVLVSSLDGQGGITSGGWRMGGFDIAVQEDDPRCGGAAIQLHATAQAAGAKGDYSIAGPVAGECQLLGLWVKLPEPAAIEKVGLQIIDAEGESLFHVEAVDAAAADGAAWRWLETDFAAGAFTQSYPQGDKNKQVDFPIKSIHAVWFAKRGGATSIIIDGLVAVTKLPAAGDPVSQAKRVASPVEIELPSLTAEPGTLDRALAVLTNYTDEQLLCEVAYSIDRDGRLFQPNFGDPVHGQDHALGAVSWTVADGREIERGSLTDGEALTASETPWHKDHHREAFQFIDLGQVRKITHLAYQSGDANWVWKLDIAASADDQTYTPIAPLTNIELHKKWGRQSIAVRAPFDARFVRLRYHQEGKGVDVIRFPAGFSIYDGKDDESSAWPKVSAASDVHVMKTVLPPRSFHLTTIPFRQKLATGAYLMLVRASGRDGRQQQFTKTVAQPVFVLPEKLPQVSSASRFGLNASFQVDPAIIRRLGVGWVRFENFKWPMTSPKRGEFRFDGSVGPWHVPHEKILRGYREQGIEVLPFLFQSAHYATSAGPEIKSRREEYPPRDPADFAEFCFQSVARYGSQAHPKDVLQTPDKTSGQGLLKTVEIWNEPNLNNPQWGAWVGTLDEYFTLLRPAVEAVKRADPQMQVTNGGFAGIDLETVDKLKSHRYADGKTPLDLIDVLNVHHYCGRAAPELALVNTNVERSGGPGSGRTFEDDLTRLVDWRNTSRPGLPIWLTETGYDTGGNQAVSPRQQAAWLPRAVLVTLAMGIDKVFVYREKGSGNALFAASGLVADDGTLRPSWFTYATLIRQLHNSGPITRLFPSDPNIRIYTWQRGGQPIVAAYAVQGEATLPLALGGCRETDSFGGVVQHDGKTPIAIDIFPRYFDALAAPQVLAPLIAASKQREQDRLARRAQAAKLVTRLFDFGPAERVGVYELGGLRHFTAVAAETKFTPERGYGFVPQAAMSEGERRWVNDALDHDHCRLGKGIEFHCTAPAGKYQLALGATPVGPAVKLVLSGMKGDPQSVEVTSEKSVVQLDIELSAAPLTVRSDGYFDLRWLTLVESAK